MISNKLGLKLSAVALALAMATVTAPAMAQKAGTWSLGAGIGWVIPKVGNGAIAGGTLNTDIGNDIKPTFTVEYFVLNNVGIQLLGAVPFTQTVRINGQHIGNLQHLPPALFVQYHFTRLLGMISPTLERVTPFLGAGIEHSFIYDESFNSPAYDGIHAHGSTGYTFHGGVDFAVNKSQAVRFDVYYININSKITSYGTTLGTTHIDPLVWNVGYVWNF